MPFMYYRFDPTYVLVIIGFILSLIASFGVKMTFSKYDKIYNSRGLTGADAARKILDAHGLQHVRIEHIAGNLSDHFDPKANVVRLSESTYSSQSVGAIGVAAHECGHAIQYATEYKPIKVRNTIVPAVNIGNALSMPLFFLGILLEAFGLALAGAILFGLVLIFQLVTLPVEFNASSRAIKVLDGMAILDNEELSGSKKVLKAAAMTYVAGAVATALQFLRLLLIVNRRRRD